MAETTWGMRFNEHPNYERVRKGEKPKDCPEWLESHQSHTWQKQGFGVPPLQRTRSDLGSWGTNVQGFVPVG